MSSVSRLRTLVRALVAEATNVDDANVRDLQRRIDMIKAWINDPATPRSQRQQYESQLAKLRDQLRAARKVARK